ncbi:MULTISPECIES: helix-turn-helix transcriptional regulator [unclassified Streptomyces]|uniref:helix-turn-helix domain-containing protein n=1 Tax=unclassified Streptomyces TaxID=2593676 RepID=UPI00081D8C44|nr:MULTISPECIES: helix-turn-helix transcriptional regulator [unclassified Streptomyces]MYR26086.1 helix-turn-helix domain-containing protein [Streptomyces sp. SID4945]SCE95178.1 Helix-turn-helix domain-containing protein [Streptomyces sp. LcepLS]
MTDFMAPNSDFSPATWTFKTEVQKLRERLGLSQRAFAERLHYSQAQVAKVENGTSPPSLAFAAAMDAVAKTGEVYQDILKRMLEEEAQPEWFGPYRDLERQAVGITSFSAIFLSGILQIEEYADAIFRAGSPGRDDQQIRALVAERLKRKEQLDRPTLRSVWLFIHEGVLHTPVGGPEIMRKQIQHLLEVARRPRVILQILPFSAGASPCHVPFTMFTMEGKNPDIVYSESPTGGQVDYSPAALAVTVEICERLRMTAASREVSVDILRAMLKEHDS